MRQGNSSAQSSVGVSDLEVQRVGNTKEQRQQLQQQRRIEQHWKKFCLRSNYCSSIYYEVVRDVKEASSTTGDPQRLSITWLLERIANAPERLVEIGQEVGHIHERCPVEDGE